MTELQQTIDAWTPEAFGPVSQWGPLAAVFLASTILFYLIARMFVRRKPVEDDGLDQPQGQGVFGSLTPALAAQLPESKKGRRDFGKLLRSAGIYSPTAKATIYALRFVLLFAPLVAAGVWALMSPPDTLPKILIIGGLSAGFLSSLPRLYVFFRRRSRMKRIRQGLADTIDMLSMCISGGLGIGESLEHVAGQLTAYPELAGELMILKKQADVGSLKQALADFAARVDLPEVRHLAGLLTRGTRLGTKLAGSLTGQADHLRTMRRQLATQQANKTPVKLVLPLLFCFAPAALILLTGPAMMELRDFLIPKPEAVAGAEPGETFGGTGAVVRAIQGLDQQGGLPVLGQQPTNPGPYVP
jgi:tight adherence protein C